MVPNWISVETINVFKIIFIPKKCNFILRDVKLETFVSLCCTVCWYLLFINKLSKKLIFFIGNQTKCNPSDQTCISGFRGFWHFFVRIRLKRWAYFLNNWWFWYYDLIELLRSAGAVIFETIPSFPWINSFLLGWKHLGTLQYRLWIEKREKLCRSSRVIPVNKPIYIRIKLILC